LDDLDAASSSLGQAICRLVEHGNDIETCRPGPRCQTTSGVWSAQYMLAANMQLTINSFRPLFPDKIFPWLTVKSPYISLTFPGFSDKCCSHRVLCAMQLLPFVSFTVKCNSFPSLECQLLSAKKSAVSSDIYLTCPVIHISIPRRVVTSVESAHDVTADRLIAL